MVFQTRDQGSWRMEPLWYRELSPCFGGQLPADTGRETWAEFQALDFSLTHFLLLQAFEESIGRWNTSFSLSHSSALSLK